MHVAGRDQFQNPHFGSAKPGRAAGEFFEHLHNAAPQLRQDAQILAQQIEPCLRRGCMIGPPRETCDFKMFARDANDGKLPLRKLLGICITQGGIDVT